MTAAATDPSPRSRRLHCDHAFVEGTMRSDVVLDIADGMITGIADADEPREGDERVAGVVLPGLVNAHSHAFHRLLRGRTHGTHVGDDVAPGSFWTWREQMYAAAAVLDPNAYRDLARAVFAEMVLAGITCVGEFHYLHHRPDGGPYDDPNVMGQAIIVAAREAGIRLTLLDTIYLTGEVGATLDDPCLDPVQRRFSDGDPHTWAQRVDALGGDVLDDPDTWRIGAAIHSVRAVPPEAMAAVADFTVGTTSGPARMLHAHVSEQPAENEAAQAHHGRSPTGLLADAGALSERFTAVHGVWLDSDDQALLGAAAANVCACPTTERDLADGVVDAAGLSDAGARLALGSDQHVVIDLFEEARALELDQRLATQRRGLHRPDRLLAAATVGGAVSLGWPELGHLRVGTPADLCVVGLESVRLAGTRTADLVAAIVFAATATDVTATMVAGRWVVRDGRHVSIDVPTALHEAIAAVDTAAREMP